MTVEKDSHDKSLAALGEQVRSRFHDDWKKESLTVVDGLKKEFSENSRLGSSMLFVGLLMSVMSAVALTGVIPTENTPDYVLALMTFLGALFLMIGVAMKASKKDILYMLEAENEILRLNEKLAEHYIVDNDSRDSDCITSDYTATIEEEAESDDDEEEADAKAKMYSGETVNSRYGVKFKR